MLLVMDVGNTQTLFGIYDGERLLHHFALSTDRARTPDEFGVLVREMLRHFQVQPGALEAAIMASVVPPVTSALKRLVTEQLGVAPLLIEPGVRTGMQVHYE